MASEWFIEKNGQTLGPFSSSQLKKMAANSSIAPQSKVRLGADGKWTTASKVQGLFSGESSQAPASVAAPVAAPVAPATKDCMFCGETIAASAMKCRHCNEFLDGRPRETPQATAPFHSIQQPVIHVNQQVSQVVGGYYKPRKSKAVAVLLALFLGGFGVHHFYMGRTLRGLLYLLFCWTLIPAILSLLEAIFYIFISDASFQARCR